MLSRPAVLSFVALLGIASSAFGQTRDCQRSSFGLTPLSDLAGGSYRGFPGGLYSGNTNAIPAAHLSAGLRHAALVVPRNAAGQPDPQGRIGVLSIGMSNTTQEFAVWKAWSDLDPRRASSVVVVDGAQSGQDARLIAVPNVNFWAIVNQRLASAGLSANQVQVVWLKQATIAPTTTQFPAHATELQGFLARIARNLHDKYPFAQLCFLSSRTYGGYSTEAQRAEPISYETAFAIREVITAQIQGEPTLNHDPALGVVRSPWLAWGPYLWADGLVRRSDGLIWRCSDYMPDGVHPSSSGRLQVSDLLDAHWKTHPCAASWYVGPLHTARAGTLTYGNPCAGSMREPSAQAIGVPTLGNAAFRLGVNFVRPNATAILLLARDRARTTLGGTCDLWLTSVLAAVPVTTSAAGTASVAAPIRADPLLQGLRVFGQWWIPDSGGTPIPTLGNFAASSGQFVQVGF